MAETTRGEGGDIPTIFNPHRIRAPPNLVITNETPRGGVPNGPFGRSSHALHHSDSESQSEQHQPVNNRSGMCSRLKSCKNSCCSKSARKIYYGVCVTVCVTASWVGATHAIKYLYLKQPHTHITSGNVTSIHQQPVMTYNAPFFTTWFCTNWTVLFFPLYMLCHLSTNRCKSGDVLAESVRSFREKGFTAGRFLTRCCFFCLLWVGTNYMYIHSLRILLATDVMALFATNVSCVYLLSWVILHEQFVGVRIVAVILCDTGVALLAYMDGITGSPTLSGVVLAASAAAGSTGSSIVAVILCDTGVALLAYMDGITGSPTLSGVVLATSAAAGSTGSSIVAVILCDTGVALLAYMDGITGSPTLSGVVLATSAAAGSTGSSIVAVILCDTGVALLAYMDGITGSPTLSGVVLATSAAAGSTGSSIVAVILCDTGVALLAYMDGITGSPTLSGVVLAASAAAGSAVYKVLFKKVIGDASYGQVSLFFSLIGLLNASLLWPLCLTLYFTGIETLYWDRLPWPALLLASILSLVANLLGNFSVALTYDLFITLGLITAVPVSAALDVVLYGAHFYGMKLAGMILISIGFFLVMFPENWPDYITRLLRCVVCTRNGLRKETIYVCETCTARPNLHPDTDFKTYHTMTLS
ncbi:hypothetical protein J6590_076749 [Homalodisca vitripennis]|nr:hypothetical protein J6590_076749 [Homalodisca vitripennis]